MKSLRRLRLAALLALLVVLAPLGALAEEEGSGLLSTPREWERALALDTRQRFPGVCRSKVHWFLGVDTSNSMRPLKLDTTKELLRLWLRDVAAEGDRVTVVAFDHQVRVSQGAPLKVGPAGQRGDLQEQVMRALDARGSGKAHGTATGDARKTILRLARSASPEDLRLALIIGDRDDDDQSEANHDGDEDEAGDGATAEPQGAGFGSSESPGSQDPLWGQASYSFRVDSKQFTLVVLTAGSPAAGAGGPLAGRRIPLLQAKAVAPPPRPVDRYKTVRQVVPLVPLLPLAVAGLLLLALQSARAGSLRHRESNSQVTIPWTFLKPSPVQLKASKNQPSMALVPLREDLGDPVVLQALVDNAKGWAPWRLRLEALTGYTFQEVASRTQETLLLPGQERQIHMVDARGPVTRASLEWTPDGRTLATWRALVLCLGLGLLLFLGYPMLQGMVPPPPPAPRAPGPPPESEPLCSGEDRPRTVPSPRQGASLGLPRVLPQPLT